jgi:hypothetical protein
VRQAFGGLAEPGQTQGDVEPVQDRHGAGCHHARQRAHAVAAVGQHRDGRGPRQVLTVQNRVKSAVGPVILTGDQADIPVIAPYGHGLADHDLDVALFVVPVPDVAAIEADDDRRLRERLALARTTVKATRRLAAAVGVVTGSDLVQVAANGAGIGGAADRQHLIQQLGSQAEGDQRGPFGFQIEPLRCGVVCEQHAQRAEGLAGRRLTPAAVTARTVQRDGAQGSAELDPARSLAQQGATAA